MCSFLLLFHYLHLLCKFDPYSSLNLQKIKIGIFGLAWIMVRRSMISNIIAQKTYTKWYGTLIFFGTVQKRRGKATLFFLASNYGLCCC